MQPVRNDFSWIIFRIYVFTLLRVTVAHKDCLISSHSVLIWYRVPWSYERMTTASFIPDTFFFFLFFVFQGRQIQTALCHPLVASYKKQKVLISVCVRRRGTWQTSAHDDLRMRTSSLFLVRYTMFHRVRVSLKALLVMWFVVGTRRWFGTEPELL